MILIPVKILSMILIPVAKRDFLPSKNPNLILIPIHILI